MHDGGTEACICLSEARSNGSCGEIHCARTAARMIAAATIEATIATGECRKLQRRSLSKNPRSRPGAAPACAATVAVVEAASSSDTGGALALDPQPRIDDVI